MDITAWLLLISVWCAPYEPLTILPTREACEETARTRWRWGMEVEMVTTLCHPLGPSGASIPVINTDACTGR